jgi:C2 domain
MADDCSLQADLQRKYELLAQLEEKYGEESAAAEPATSASKHAALAWRATGELTVDVIAAESLSTSRQAHSLLQRMRSNVKASVHGLRAKAVSKATAWRTGVAPVWNEKLSFERCCRDDALLLQVRGAARRRCARTCSAMSSPAKSCHKLHLGQRMCCLTWSVTTIRSAICM